MEIIAYPTHNGRYTTNHVAIAQKTPFYTTARKLLDDGHDGDTVVQCYMVDKPSFRAPLKELAKWTVVENANDGPRIQKYTPSPYVR